MSTLRALAAAATVAALALLAGCSGASSASRADPVAAGSAAEDGSYSKADGNAEAVPAPAPAGQPDTTLTPKLARTAQVSLTVPDVEDAAVKLRSLAASMNGQVTAENLVTETDAEAKQRLTSVMVISVPAEALDSTLEQLKSIGTVTNRVISSEDVTTQVADVDSRVHTLNDSIARLRELWRKAGSVRELSELESQITDRISERDSLVAQQRALAGRVANSPVTISLTVPEPASELETTGFMGGLLAGWNALVSSSRMLMTVVGAVLPFAAAVAIIAVPLLVWRRRKARLHRPDGKGPGQAAASGGGTPDAGDATS